MEKIFEYLVLIVPLTVLHFGLMAFCIVKIFREGVSMFNRWVWVVIVVLLNLIGPILYLTIGRKKDSYDTGSES